MKRAAVGVLLLLMAGCGNEFVVDRIDCPGAGGCAEDNMPTGGDELFQTGGLTSEERDSSADGTPGWPQDGVPDGGEVALPPANVGFDILGEGWLDWLGGDGFDVRQIPRLFPLLSDNLAIDIISPSPSRGGRGNLTLLCIDVGIPEHVCRRRYGR